MCFLVLSFFSSAIAFLIPIVLNSLLCQNLNQLLRQKALRLCNFLSPFPTMGQICHVSSILGLFMYHALDRGCWGDGGFEVYYNITICEVFLTLSFQRAISTSCAFCGFYWERAFINACLDVCLHCFQQILHNCCKRSLKDCISPCLARPWCGSK